MPQITHTTDGRNLADILERLLDKGVVIAGDIRIRIVEVELLTISIRLVISSVERAREMGIDWWTRSSFLTTGAVGELGPGEMRPIDAELRELRSRLDRLDATR
jgi:Gas vesicle protein